MHRSSILERLGLRSKAHGKPRDHYTRLSFEALEERRLLTAYNLLVSTLEPTGGNDVTGYTSSVLEYSEATKLQLPGGVYTGDQGLSYATGVAVAPDGSYYVSSPGSGPGGTGQVLHYSRSGVFLNALGANDANPATLIFPGTLAFGPNGNLYVADLYGQAVYQFDTTSTTQQLLPTATLSSAGGQLPAYFQPAGLTFADNSTHDLIVGDFGTGEVLQFNADGSSTVLIEPNATDPGNPGVSICPLAILPLSGGRLLIADSDPGGDSTGHHQILLYDPSNPADPLTTYINFDTPFEEGQNLPQPISLMLDADGNLLVGLSPDHLGHGAIEKFSIGAETGTYLETIVSGIGTPTGLALAPVAASDILFGTSASGSGSVLRYNDATQLPVPGGVAAGSEGLDNPDGVAVAPDGSYYVSDSANGEVLHFGNSGNFLGVLGVGELEQPGALIFGPNGHLYVADSGVNKIFQFDTSASFAADQYLSADTISLSFSPGGIAFANDLANDLIVGDLTDQSVVSLSTTPPTTLVSGVDPVAIVSEPNGNLLIADSSNSRVLEYDPTATPTPTTTQRINFDTTASPPEPTSLLLDTDGNLLVGLSTGVVDKYNLQSTPAVLSETVATTANAPLALALVPSEVSELLVGNFDDNSVLRYSSAGQPLAAGGVPGGDQGLDQVSGVAVAPDGSYYVSCLTNANPMIGVGEVLHYSNTGVFLNALELPDESEFITPGTVAFGPNGDLYVADLGASYLGYPGGVIYEFDTSSAGDPLVNTIVLPTDFTPLGFTFAADATRGLIVGDYATGEVLQYSADGTSYATLVQPYATDPNNSSYGIFPISILSLGNGELLIANSDPGGEPDGHHDILLYDPSNPAGLLTTYMNFDTPFAAGQPLPQPTSLLLTPNDDLLVGLSPDHTGDAAVEEFDMADQEQVPLPISSIGTPAGLALAPPNVVMPVSAADWTTATSLTVKQSSGDLHVYQTGTTNNVVTSQSVASAGEIQVTGTDNATNTLVVDFSGGSPVPPDGIVFAGVQGSETNTVAIQDSTGSNVYTLNGTQLSLNGVTAVTMTNTQALDLNLGSGSLDLDGGYQAIGSIQFVQGSMRDGTLSSGLFTIQSGTISANLAGPGELVMAGPGTATLSGSNSYEGGTMVTGGTLDVTNWAALPSGTSLTIGAGAASLFGSPVVVQAPLALLSASAVDSDVPVAAPLQVQTTESGSTTAQVSSGSEGGAHPPCDPAVFPFAVAWRGPASLSPPAAATLPVVVRPAAWLSKAANTAPWRIYPRSTGSTVVAARGMAGYLAWWDSSSPSSNSGDSTVETDRRLAALDVVLSQYGSR